MTSVLSIEIDAKGWSTLSAYLKEVCKEIVFETSPTTLYGSGMTESHTGFVEVMISKASAKRWISAPSVDKDEKDTCNFQFGMNFKEIVSFNQTNKTQKVRLTTTKGSNLTQFEYYDEKGKSLFRSTAYWMDYGNIIEITVQPVTVFEAIFNIRDLMQVTNTFKNITQDEIIFVIDSQSNTLQLKSSDDLYAFTFYPAEGTKRSAPQNQVKSKWIDDEEEEDAKAKENGVSRKKEERERNHMNDVQMDQEQLALAMENKLLIFKTKLFHQFLGLATVCPDIRLSLLTLSLEAAAIRLTVIIPGLGSVISTLAASIQ